MKNIVVLLLAFSCGALYGVCSCQRPKPQPQPVQTQQQVTEVPQEKTDSQALNPVKKITIAPKVKNSK